MTKKQDFGGTHASVQFEVAIAHHGLIEVIQAQTTDLVADWTRLRRTRKDAATVAALFADNGGSDFGEQAVTFFFGNWKLYLEHQIEGDGSDVEYVMAWVPLTASWVCIDVHKADWEVALKEALHARGPGNVEFPSSTATIPQSREERERCYATARQRVRLPLEDKETLPREGYLKKWYPEEPWTGECEKCKTTRLHHCRLVPGTAVIYHLCSECGNEFSNGDSRVPNSQHEDLPERRIEEEIQICGTQGCDAPAVYEVTYHTPGGDVKSQEPCCDAHFPFEWVRSSTLTEEVINSHALVVHDRDYKVLGYRILGTERVEEFGRRCRKLMTELMENHLARPDLYSV